MSRPAPLRRRFARRLLALAALAFCCGATPAASQRPRDAEPAGQAPAAGGIPVLAWHFFKDRPTPADGTLTESFSGFEETLAFLKREGFRSVFPEEAGAAGGRRVVLTFDDGRKESLRAAEIMERHGFRGIFFLIPGRTTEGSEHFLTPEEAHRLARAGHRVAAHGYEHRSMASSGTEVAASLARSPRMLAEQTRSLASPLDFAFPFGHYTPEVAEALGASYRYLHTVNPGYWDGRSALLPRMLIMSSVDPALYRGYLLGAGRYAPRLEPLSDDGAVTGLVAFRVHGGPLPRDIELFSVSADATGRSYVSHLLGESLRVSGDTVRVDLAAHMRRFYAPERGAIAYALVAREGGEVRFLSPGIQHWIRDPATGPWVSVPPERAGAGGAGEARAGRITPAPPATPAAPAPPASAPPSPRP